MYKIKDLKNYIIIPSDEFYNEEDWYEYVRPVIQKVLMSFFGDRDLLIDSALVRGNLDKIKDGSFVPDILVDYVKNIIDSLFMMNNQSYARIYDALFSEYNPLWNVDGTETLTYRKDNTGTQGNDNTRTGNVTDNLAYTGQSQNVRTGSIDSQVAPEDTNNFYNTERESYNNLTDTQSFTNRGDNRTTTYNQVKDASLRTDQLKEEYTETKVRHGNIGVTKSTELVESETVLREKYNFINIVAKDIANMISYMC